MSVTDHAPDPNSIELTVNRQLTRTERADQRIHARQVVAWRANILVSRSHIVACAVLNISVGGARLRLRQVIDLPGTFTLSIARFGDLHAELLDQQQKEIRVAFLDDPEQVQGILGHSLPIAGDKA